MANPPPTKESGTHPSVDPDGFAVEYDCGCIEEWCADEWVAGVFLTRPCDQHQPKERHP